MQEIVIKIDENLYTRLFDNGTDFYETDDILAMAKAIRKGTPLPKGHWVYKPRKRMVNETDEGVEYRTEYWCKCSNCDADYGFTKMKDAYCRYCGAKMESEDEE